MTGSAIVNHSSARQRRQSVALRRCLQLLPCCLGRSRSRERQAGGAGGGRRPTPRACSYAISRRLCVGVHRV